MSFGLEWAPEEGSALDRSQRSRPRRRRLGSGLALAGVLLWVGSLLAATAAWGQGPGDLGLEEDPTGRWERSMSRFQAAQFRRDPVASREAVLELVVLALGFDELDLRVDRTTAAIDQLLQGLGSAEQASEGVLLLRSLHEAAVAGGSRDHVLLLHVNERLGRLLIASGEAEAAVEVLREVVRGAEVHFGPGSLPALGARTQLAQALAGSGQPAEAIALLREIISDEGTREGETIEARLTMGRLEALLGEQAAALRSFEAVRELADTRRQHLHAYGAVIGVGTMRLAQGELRLAEQAFRDAERRAREVRLAQPLYAPLFRGRGSVALASGDISRAIALFGKALEFAEGGGPPAANEARHAEGGLALAFVFAGREDEARRIVKRIAAELSAPGSHGLEELEVVLGLSEVLSRLGVGKQAVEYAEAALRGIESAAGREALSVAMVRTTLARAQLAAGKPKDAAKQAKKGLERIEARLGKDHPAAAEARVVLAGAQLRRGKGKQALALVDDAIPVLERVYGNRGPLLAEAIGARAAALERTGDAQAAVAERERVARLEAAYRSGGAAIASAPGGIVEMAEFNFRIEPPGSEWRSAEPGAFGGARVALYRENPPVLFAVLTEPAEAGQYTPEFLELALRTNLRNENDDVAVERAGPRSVAGIAGAEVVARVVRGTSAHRLALWAGHHGAHVYRLVVYAEDFAVTAEQHHEQAERLLAAFSLIDPGKSPGEPVPAPGIRYASERFGYEIDLEGTRWSEWPRQIVEQPHAEFGAMHPDGGILLVLPVSLLGTQPGQRVGVNGLLGMLDVESAAEPREVTAGGLSGVELDFGRTSQGVRYDGRVRALIGDDVGYAVLALADRSLGERREELLRVVEQPRFPKQAPAVRAEDLMPGEKSRHAHALNQMGIAAQAAGSRGQAIALFGVARELLPGDLVIAQNLAHVQIESGRYTEAIAALEGEPETFAGNVELLAYRAVARGGTGDVDGAIRDYESAFAMGFEDEELLADFAAMLWSAGRSKRAFEILDEAIAKQGSVALRIARASLRRQAGEHEAASDDLERIAASPTASPQVLAELIMVYHESGRHHDAIDACDRYAAAFGPSVDLLVQRAQSEYELGLYREAMDSLDAAIDLEPGATAAIEFRSVLAALLGEGDASVLREPLDPVPLPKGLLAGARLDPASLADAGGGYLHRVEAVLDAPGEGRRRTIYLSGRIENARGADALSTVQYEFDPIWERAWVNELVVRDAAGKVVAGKDDAEVYVLDAGADEGITTSGKVLHVAVPGLRDGASFELVVTRQEHQASDRFSLLDRVLSAGVPVGVSALYVRGDLENVSEWTTGGVERKRFGDGVAWVSRQPPPWRWEPMGESSNAHLPRVLLGDSRDTWEGLAREYAGELEGFLETSPPVAGLAPKALREDGPPDEKARVAAEVVQDSLAYKALLFGVRARKPSDPAEILSNRFGDCKDHSVLLLQLLAHSGLEPRLALVSLGQPIEPSVPSLDQFDHMIVWCEGCGQSGFLDATDKDLSLVRGVPRGLAGRHALLLDAKQPRLVRIPEYRLERHKVEIDREVAISDQGNVAVQESAVMHGHWGASFRGALRATERSQWKDVLQQQIFDGHRGSRLTAVRADNLEDPSEPLTLHLEYDVRGSFSVDEGRLIGRVPAILESAYLDTTPIEDRTSAFEIRYPLQLQSRARVAMPDGFSVAGRLRKVESEPSARYLDYRGSFEPGKGEAFVRFELTRRPGRHPASEYAGYYRESSGAMGFFDRALELTGP